MKTRLLILVSALVPLLLCTITASAIAGGVTGTITDPKGAAVRDAVISLADPITNQAATAISDEQGRYKFEALPAGIYILTVTAKGFNTVRRENVRLEEDRVTTLDFKLEPATVEASVTVTEPALRANANPTYRELRKQTDDSRSFSENVFTVHNLILKREAATLTLKTGELYFPAPVEGRITGAVFFGEGEMTLTPPNEVEKNSLDLFIGDKTLTEQFTEVVLRFTDKTFEEIKVSANASVAKATQAAKARDAYRDKQALMRKRIRTNLDLRTLMDIYSPKLSGYFLAFINGKRYNKLIYVMDPNGVAEVSPEEVALISYGTTDGGIWTSFHLADEYTRGIASSSQDHRAFEVVQGVQEGAAAVDVQVVGGLVEDQQVRPLHGHHVEQQPGALAA